MSNATGKCCLCGGTYNRHGCNPDPLGDPETERCCHDCDDLYVIPTRMWLAGFTIPRMLDSNVPTEILRRFMNVVELYLKRKSR